MRVGVLWIVSVLVWGVESSPKQRRALVEEVGRRLEAGELGAKAMVKLAREARGSLPGAEGRAGEILKQALQWKGASKKPLEALPEPGELGERLREWAADQAYDRSKWGVERPTFQAEQCELQGGDGEAWVVMCETRRCESSPVPGEKDTERVQGGEEVVRVEVGGSGLKFDEATLHRKRPGCLHVDFF